MALADQLPALESRLATLEAAQHPTKLQEWLDLMEQLKRYLSRISAVEQRLKAREDPAARNADPVTSALLRSKYPHSNGG